MFRLVGRLVARPSVPLYVMRGARTRRAKEDDPIAAAKAAIQPRRRGRPSSQMSEDLLERAPRRSAIPVPGALLKDKDLLEDTESMMNNLDMEGEDTEFMSDVSVKSVVVDLPEEEEEAQKAEDRFFQGFFAKKETMYEDTGEGEEEDLAEDDRNAELIRKLGSHATVSDNEEAELRDNQKPLPRPNVILKGVRGNAGSKRPGFEPRGRKELEELLQNEAKERERQRRVHVEDDLLYVGDVRVPYHLEKWVLDPEGDHKRRYRQQRLKEERLKLWYETHGMYYQRKKQSGFKRDPVDTQLTIRQKRISMLIEEALHKVLSEDLEHEKVPAFNIEAVEVAVDMKRAKIMWGSDLPGQSINGFLHKMTPTIRMLLTKRIQLKFSPVLEFIQTDYERKQKVVDKVLDQVERERTAHKEAGLEDVDEEEMEGEMEEEMEEMEEENETRSSRKHNAALREIEENEREARGGAVQKGKPKGVRLTTRGMREYEEQRGVQDEWEQDEEDEEEIEEEYEEDEVMPVRKEAKKEVKKEEKKEKKEVEEKEKEKDVEEKKEKKEKEKKEKEKKEKEKKEKEKKEKRRKRENKPKKEGEVKIEKAKSSVKKTLQEEMTLEEMEQLELKWKNAPPDQQTWEEVEIEVDEDEEEMVGEELKEMSEEEEEKRYREWLKKDAQKSKKRSEEFEAWFSKLKIKNVHS